MAQVGHNGDGQRNRGVPFPGWKPADAAGTIWGNQRRGEMNREGHLIARWVKTPSLLVSATALAGFTIGLLVTLRLNLPIWSLLLPLAGVAYGLLVVQRPVVGLFVVLFIFFLPLRLGGVTLLQLVGVVTAAFVTLSFMKRKGSLLFGSMFIPMAIFGILIVASLFYTKDTEKTLFFVRKWAFNMMFYMLLLNVVTTFDSLKRVTWAIIAAAALNASVGIWEFAGSSEFYFRSEGLIGNENGLGNLSALGFPLAFYHFLYSKGRLRWIGLALSILLAAGVVVSVSRGAFLSLILVFLLIAIRERHRRGMIAAAVLAALLAAPVLPRYFKQRMGTLSTDVRATIPVGTEQLSVRGYYTKGALKIWMAHPVVGVGVGNFGQYFTRSEFNPGKSASTSVAVHNLYLQVLVEFGAVGVSVLLWIILLAFKGVRVALREHRHRQERWVHASAIAMMALTVFIYNFSSGNLMSQGAWAVVGLIAVTRRVPGGEDEADLHDGTEAVTST